MRRRALPIGRGENKKAPDRGAGRGRARPAVRRPPGRRRRAPAPAEADPGTIRGDYGLDLGRNVIHASDHEDEGANERDTSVFFDDDELLHYEQAPDEWRYE